MASIINNSVILALATPDVSSSLVSGVLLPVDLQAEVDKQAAKYKADQTKAAAEEITKMTQIADSKFVTLSQQQAKLQRDIAEIEEQKAQIKKAFAYGNVSRNYTPLSILLGQGFSPSTPKELLTIPEGWEVPTAAAAATTAA